MGFKGLNIFAYDISSGGLRCWSKVWVLNLDEAFLSIEISHFQKELNETRIRFDTKMRILIEIM